MHVYLDNGYGFLVDGGFIQQFALRTGHERCTPEGHAILITYAVDGDDGQSVGHGVSALYRLPGHALALLFLGSVIRLIADGGGVDEQLGALQGHQACSLGVPLIPAYQYA